MYDRFFNIHVPKTGGTYFRLNILRPMLNELNRNNIAISNDVQLLNNNYNPTWPHHSCWFKPYIKDSTYIYTQLRDPAKRIVSQYAWQCIRAINLGISNNTPSDITKDNFYAWFEKNQEYYKNFQSKNLTYYNEDHSIYQKAYHTGWPEGGIPNVESYLTSKEFLFDVNKEELFNNIKKINLLIRSEDFINIDFQNMVMQKIASDLNLNFNMFNIKEKTYANENGFSSQLFKAFTADEVEKLYEHSPLDSEIYFSNFYTSIA